MKDTDLMPIGKHVGKRMIDVPASYLLWIGEEIEKKFYKNRTLNESKVLKYIEENKQVLDNEVSRNN